MKLLGEIEINDLKVIAELSRNGRILFEDLDERKIKFDATVELDEESEVSIHTSIDDDEIVDKFFHFKMITKDDQGIGLTLNIDQARALAEILQSYVEAYDLLRRCKGRTIKVE